MLMMNETITERLELMTTIKIYGNFFYFIFSYHFSMSEPFKIIFTKQGYIDGRCELARALKQASADKNAISQKEFKFSNEGLMDKTCAGYLAIKEKLGDVEIQLKGPYIKLQSDAHPFKIVHKKFPDEYIEAVLNTMPDSFDQDFWDSCTNVFDKELNIIPDDQVSSLESYDESILNCLEKHENLTSADASKRLTEVWNALLELPVPLEFKEYARDLFNTLKDHEGHIVVRKNAKIPKLETK